MAVTHEIRAKRKEIDALNDVKKDIEKKLDMRQDCNREIVKILKEIVDNNSALRFGQILSMLELDKDRFNEESVDTLKSIRDILKTL
jgi:hypothetical protein